MVAHIELTDGIEQSVDDPRIRALYLQWKEATKYDGLPKAAPFMPDVSPFAGSLMVLHPTKTKGFYYDYYGTDIASVTGFSIMGKYTADFDSEIGQFFEEKYRQALEIGAPIYTVHHGTQVQSVVSWARIILPLRDADGDPAIVCFNTVMDQKTVLFDSLLESSLDGIVIFTPKLGKDREVEDFRYLVVNPVALDFLKKKEDILGKGLLEIFPNGRGPAFDAFKRVWQTGKPERVELDYRFEELGIFLLVSAVKALDHLVVSLSDRTSLKEVQEQMELQNADLAFSNDSLQEQAENLVNLAEEADIAMREAKNAQLFTRDLLEAIPMPIYFRDIGTGNIALANRRYADLYDIPHEEITKKPITELLPPERLAQIDEKDKILYGSDDTFQSYEVDVNYPSIGLRRVIFHKAKMHDLNENVIGITGVVVDVTESHQMQRELQRLATTDPLTGLSNRRSFMSSAEKAIAEVRRHQKEFTLIVMDIDHFKSVNDTYGHEAGDIVLKRMAELLMESFRISDDTVARTGGEEFAIILGRTNVENAHKVAERLRANIEKSPVETEAGTISFTASIGIAQFDPSSDVTIDSTMRRADAALYEAKEGGRNRVVLASPKTSSAE